MFPPKSNNHRNMEDGDLKNKIILLNKEGLTAGEAYMLGRDDFKKEVDEKEGKDRKSAIIGVVVSTIFICLLVCIIFFKHQNKNLVFVLSILTVPLVVANAIYMEKWKNFSWSLIASFGFGLGLLFIGRGDYTFKDAADRHKEKVDKEIGLDNVKPEITKDTTEASNHR